eukprot:1161686-Pelagomonas_calceolata.AAC.8
MHTTVLACIAWAMCHTRHAIPLWLALPGRCATQDMPYHCGLHCLSAVPHKTCHITVACIA